MLLSHIFCPSPHFNPTKRQMLVLLSRPPPQTPPLLRPPIFFPPHSPVLPKSLKRAPKSSPDVWFLLRLRTCTVHRCARVCMCVCNLRLLRRRRRPIADPSHGGRLRATVAQRVEQHAERTACRRFEVEWVEVEEAKSTERALKPPMPRRLVGLA